MISDDNYAIYTGVALTSLKINRAETSRYAIYILSDNISEENKNRLLSLQDERMTIHIIEATGYEDVYRDLIIKGIPATPSALYKFKIPYFFQELDRIIYIDGDVLFYKDIAGLFDYDLNGYYAIVTPENLPSNEIPYSSKRIGIDHRIYFNSGLMFLNLKKLREDNISDKLFEYRINGINYLMDQDAFNVVIGNNVSYYPTYYFTAFYELAKKQSYSKYGEKRLRAIIKKTWIMHLAYKKPWKMKMPFVSRQYSYYHELSPFCDIPIRPRSYIGQIYHRYIKRTKVGIFLRTVKHKVFSTDIKEKG